MPESWSQVADKSRNLVVVPCRFPGLLTTLHFSCVVVAVSASPGLRQDMTGCFQFLRHKWHFALRTPRFKERCFIWFVQCPITNKVLDMDGRATQDLSLVHSATAMGEEPGWQIQSTNPSTSSNHHLTTCHFLRTVVPVAISQPISAPWQQITAVMRKSILFDPFCWRLLAVQHLRCFCFCLIFILIPVQTYDLSLKPWYHLGSGEGGFQQQSDGLCWCWSLCSDWNTFASVYSSHIQLLW